jgi:beta-glucosidase
MSETIRRAGPRVLRTGGRHHRRGIAILLTTALVAGGVGGAVPAANAAEPAYRDASLPVGARVDDLLARMTLDEKVGQMTQAERKVVVDNADVTAYALGSLLSGGGSAPTPNTATAWADMADGFQRQAMATRLAIPLIYGIDAVHGHNNVHGATVFPHNIGLGATRDPDLVQRIGRAVAEEVKGTGIPWDFAPCLCVARNDRWGRTYESFGERPELVSAMTSFITGMQGAPLNGSGSVLATAKHFIGDGGTTGGKDQGNTELSEAELRAVHLPPFAAAVRRGVGSVMISYSSFNGLKMHAHRYLVTDVLKGELGFSGFVVSDWEAIDQIDGSADFTAEEVRTAVNAGVDMVMVPDDYRRFISYLKQEVQAGRVPMSRIDDANRRILTKKMELGLFEKPYADRSYMASVGSTAHRDLAREAVRRSQVLLKNTHDTVLPLSKTAPKVFVAGKAADDIGLQSGGWTIEWQGGSGPLTPGTTILQGIRDTMAPGTEVRYDREGAGLDDSFNYAVAVIGERPYAEFFGDRTDDLRLDAEDQKLIRRMKATGVPLVVVLVSGRPLNINAELDASDAFVAAWLPGTEGRGVADVLFGDHNPSGALPVTWPWDAGAQPINDGDGKAPRFSYGYGLRYPATQDGNDYIGSVFFDDQRGTRSERCTDDGCGQSLSYLADGDYAGYDAVEFGPRAPTQVQLRYASGAATGGTVEFRAGSPSGTLIAAVPVANTGGWQQWRTATVPTVGPVTGRHRLYQVFRGASGADFVNTNWFRFSGGGRDAAVPVQAESADVQYGTGTAADPAGGRYVGWIAPGDTLSFHGVDFGGTAPGRVTARLASGSATAGTVDVRLDSTTGPVIATLAVAGTGGWTSWQERPTPVTSTVTGNRSVHLTFTGTWGNDLVNLDWIRFDR